uniref:Protein FAR-RED ELONGATED HYPOCOTYL 1 n=1 Tax=Noccaea caerulescens TaxID=107243 RepID=A0A1J3DVA2_NOCCA
MPKREVDNEKQSEINSLHHMISNQNVLKMEAVEVSKKRKFQTDQSELSLLPLPKHACFDNVACFDNTDGKSELDSEYSMSYVNSTSMECENEVEMKEESSGSCSEDKMISFESHLDFIYGTQKLEDFSEKDIENILYLDEKEEEEEAQGCSNAANFVLSSGRWSVNQEDSTQHGIKKPTIDQEFEQYFSTLML